MPTVARQTHSADTAPAPASTGPIPSGTGPDHRAFRQALGRFATGVTVVTTVSATGERLGITISSFNAVSLDPPLVLWSLARTSPHLDAFRDASHYAINVLAEDQQVLSDRFASRLADRFAGVPVHSGLGGVPLLDGCCTVFECTPEACHEGGDHLIFVGRVARFRIGERSDALLFHNGRYRRLAKDN